MIQGVLFKMSDEKGVKNLNEPIVFNIGYEGRSLRSMVKRLRRFKVDVVVDVRSRPYSRNPEFCKETIKRELKNFGIRYLWRGKELGGFGVSRKSWVQNLKEIAQLAQKEKICLMCMEKNVKQCHRRQLCKILDTEYGLQNFNL